MSLAPPGNSQVRWMSTERSLHPSTPPSLQYSTALSRSRLHGVFCNNFGGYRDYASGELRLGSRVLVTDSPVDQDQKVRNMSKIWFVTGSSRGLGRTLVEAILAAGDKVVATARKPEELKDLSTTYGDSIHAVKLDVTSPTDVAKAVAAALKAFGRIDVLVNNAGYGFLGAFEEMSDQEFKGQIDTNFWGVVNVTRAILPHLRQQGSGHIIQITSVGGRNAFPGLSGYHAAKFAVEGLSEALALEVKPLGLKVTIVEPGGFRTDWAGSSMAFAKPMEAYAPTIGFMREQLDLRSGNQPGDPRKAAQAILKLVDMPEAPLRLPLGNDALAVLRNGYKTTAEELERWAEITKSTDFDGLPVSDTGHAVLEILKGKSS
jgi:NAD(P)-dependent dehydrogenase (short-subunit alcohol dehydrogenase family)